MHSTICQHIWLYSDSRRIDFETEIDWHEHHQILKAAFPLDVLSSTATYDIQFGHVSRPTHENTSWDKAKFEVYGHKWVDISEPGYGVSLLNDCKYGHNTEGSTLKLTMLKSGTYPNPEADQGIHTFTYSLLPHMGDFRSAGVIREAYNLNQPLLASPVTGENGDLPTSFSLVSCDNESIIIETVKKAEVDNGMIVRFYESFGGKTNATVQVAPGFTKAYLCDLMENELQELPIRNDCVSLPIHNFEIVTLKFVR
jgi:alpha-mannosidase